MIPMMIMKWQKMADYWVVKRNAEKFGILFRHNYVMTSYANRIKIGWYERVYWVGIAFL